jgi:hypothetical protein
MLILALAMVSAGAQNVKKGDANGDQVVDAKDVTEVSNALMGNPSDKYIKVNADANSDEKVNAADVVTIVNMIFTANLRLVILKKDGTVLKFDVADKPKVSYSGNDLVLTTTKTTVQLPVYLLQKISFENSSSE